MNRRAWFRSGRNQLRSAISVSARRVRFQHGRLGMGFGSLAKILPEVGAGCVSPNRHDELLENVRRPLVAGLNLSAQAFVLVEHVQQIGGNPPVYLEGPAFALKAQAAKQASGETAIAVVVECSSKHLALPVSVASSAGLHPMMLPAAKPSAA